MSRFGDLCWSVLIVSLSRITLTGGSRTGNALPTTQDARGRAPGSAGAAAANAPPPPPAVSSSSAVPKLEAICDGL